jgi:ABC-type transporter MlaC component
VRAWTLPPHNRGSERSVKGLTWGVAGTMKLKLKSRRDIGLLVVVVLLASAVNARALEGADAAAFIRALGERTVNLLRDSSDDREALTRGMAELLDEAAAVDVMAKLMLGLSWRRANEAQGQTYVELCRSYILGTLAYRFASYTGSERFVITGTRPAGSDTIVASRIEYVGYPPLILEWRVRGG